MKLSLTSRQRATLLFLSASGYLAGFSGLGDRIEAQGLGKSDPATFTIAQTGRVPNVAAVIRRDPFAGKPADGTTVSATPPPASHAQVAPAAGTDRENARGDAALAIANDAGGATVPNIGTEPTVVAQGSEPTLTLALRATITGPNPVAYVQNGTVMDIARVGDTLGERRIAKIDLRGIAFADGTRLDLPETALSSAQQPATGAPHPPAARALTIDDLRRLLVPAHPQATVPNEPTAPAPAPSSNYPTPAPLPTIDQRGLPVGVNPTPDPNAPTAYPYPYPYAPPVPHER
ncbi:MAG: hypothetical protein GIX03_07915 [Candidatus Eremiobacteraeota bacterium]|nr:hypothetical protein [Candidatus Eremiobacteraeota bacterium]MBC5802913.1 hypothetical protein [Candidatus Eremiobacteraeota bacterium]MBC5821135.1 hypothetical protein [Candidatus Eremiobacteraeota bacterium]